MLREKGAKIDPDKLEAVHALPYEFKTWIELQKGRKRGFKGCDSGISAPEVVRWSPGIGASHTHFCESGKLADNVKTVSRCSGRPNTLSDGSMAEPKE